ncbi:MAG: hypothetical protein V4858_23400 [Pseudomonadota bacterium]
MTPIDDYRGLRLDLPGTWVADVLELGYDPNLPDDHGDYLLTLACEYRELKSVCLALAAGANPNRPNAAGNSPLLCVLAAGVDGDGGHPDVPDIVRALLLAGANASVSDAWDIPVSHVLVRGKDAIRPSLESFRQWRAARVGVANPSVMSNPVWDWLVRTRLSAYSAVDVMQAGHASAEDGPGWSFHRFGCSTTVLPDGRVVFIAGEHEDFYDSDFFIYNDVVVAHSDGSLDIYGYPREVFPPTDSHTATLLPGCIVLIGSIGYPDSRRYGQTQVLTLSLNTFEIQAMPTSGGSPGWIHGHSATLSPDGQAIVVSGGRIELAGDKSAHDNGDEWALDVTTWSWSCRRLSKT